MWIDKRSIYFLTTLHKTNPTATVRRREPDGTRTDRECPPLLPDYEKYMGGVDHGDQMRVYYNVGRRTRKWWKRTFAYIMEVSIFNAYVLESFVRLSSNRERDFLSFRLELEKALTGSFSSRQRVGRPRSVGYGRLDRLNAELRHLPRFVERKRRCVVCLEKMRRGDLPTVGHRHETFVQCRDCGVHLCVARDRECYYLYHTHVHFARH